MIIFVYGDGSFRGFLEVIIKVVGNIVFDEIVVNKFWKIIENIVIKVGNL